MRKGNVITIAVLAILSLVFLWLWNALGFSFTDPVDLAITIVWWVVIIAVGRRNCRDRKAPPRAYPHGLRCRWGSLQLRKRRNSPQQRG